MGKEMNTLLAFYITRLLDEYVIVTGNDAVDFFKY